MFLSAVIPQWRKSLTVVKPETLVGWSKGGFKALWLRLSRPNVKKRRDPRVPEWAREQIREWARDTRWGSKRIAGELKSKEPREHGVGVRFLHPTWFFGQVHVFFVMKLGTREVLHWNVTNDPSHRWTEQQSRARPDRPEGRAQRAHSRVPVRGLSSRDGCRAHDRRDGPSDFVARAPGLA